MAAMVVMSSFVFGLAVFGVPLVLLFWVRRAL
jgi:cytochrome c oxidase assembly factor CtaG